MRGYSPGKTWNIIKQELSSLPANEDITKTYSSKWGGVLLVDGAYVKIKGWEKAAAFIYVIDFETHDIPCGFLDLSENEGAFLRLFSVLKEMGYPLRSVVADDVPALKPALRQVFPDVGVQLCHVHILRNIKTTLGITRENITHLPFFLKMRTLLATPGEGAKREAFSSMLVEYGKNSLYRFVLLGLDERWDDLVRYEQVRKKGVRCPRTTNLIEAYNNHFKSRVRSIKGFESFSSAMRFLNAWLIKRRFTPFDGCRTQFKHLNGYSYKRSLAGKVHGHWFDSSRLQMKVPCDERLRWFVVSKARL